MEVLSFIKIFFEALDSNHIRYIHWKSNMNLHNALLGEDDLDILVHPEDNSILSEVFDKLDIIRGYSEKDVWQKDVVHYYGLDKTTGIIVHIHLHYALPVGYDYNKNFVLPVVDAVLEHKERLYDVNISAPEYEYVLLIVRILIKNALTPFLLSSPKTQLNLVRGKKIVTGYSLNEFNDLTQKINRNKLKEVIGRDFSFIGNDFFKECEKVIQVNSSLFTFLRVANKLKKKLKPYRTNNELYSFSISFVRINKNRLLKIKNKFFPKKIKGTKYPEYGGKIFAFIGGDGAGKSTNIEKLRKNLSKIFATTSIHVGKPPKSFIGGSLYYFSRILSLIGLKSIAKNTMYLRLAIDRKRAFQKAVKLRNKGIVVILDRIPMPNKITAMDTPRIDEKKYPRLSKFERKQYKEITGVDLLFVMKLNPEIALQRRPEDNPEQLRIRSGQVWTGEWSSPYCIVSDTGVLNFQEVEQRIMQNVWGELNIPYKKIELLGLSGVGKSSIVKKIADNYENILLNIKPKDFPTSFIKASLKYPQGLFSRFNPSGKNRLSRLSFNNYFLSDVITKLFNKRYSLNSHLVLDQSIVFSLVFSLKEALFSEAEFADKVNTVAPFFDFVVLLTAPKEVLFERVKTRKNQGVGRAKDMSYKEFEHFYDDYSTAFQQLYKTDLNILEIDSSKYSIEQVVELIINHNNEFGKH